MDWHIRLSGFLNFTHVHSFIVFVDHNPINTPPSLQLGASNIGSNCCFPDFLLARSNSESVWLPMFLNGTRIDPCISWWLIVGLGGKVHRSIHFKSIQPPLPSPQKKTHSFCMEHSYSRMGSKVWDPSWLDHPTRVGKINHVGFCIKDSIGRFQDFRKYHLVPVMPFGLRWIWGLLICPGHQSMQKRLLTAI